MRILFLAGSGAGRVRHFIPVVRLLAERGHIVRLAGTPRKGRVALPEEIKHPLVSVVACPQHRSDAWRVHVHFLRSARDYVRYLDPRYADARLVARRGFKYAPPSVVAFLDRFPQLRQRWKLLKRLLAAVEALVPSDPGIESFILAEKPDVILVTPLVEFGSYQTDYIKSAHRLGIPVAYLPYSWDNLTNRGLVKAIPDRAIVWNETQRQELIQLHDFPPDRIVVTGAARFDDFFALRPATSRQQFCEQAGIDPGRPFILYLGSNSFVAGREIEFVQLWAKHLRAYGADDLRDCGILVRPHPATDNLWREVSGLGLPNTAIWMPGERLNADQELYDALYHASAVVGLNTSAMIEAGILGKPVYTVVLPGFDDGQVGTLHFDYLIRAGGGVASVAHDLDEHCRQLVQAIGGDQGPSERSLRFVEYFVRPQGLDRPVTPLVVSEIERLAELRKTPGRAPLWQIPLRWGLLLGLEKLRPAPGRSGKAVAEEEANSMPGEQWADSKARRTPSSVPELLRRAEDCLYPATTDYLQELATSTEPILVGPWVGSVTDELLFWIPFVRWAAAAYQLPGDRLVVISRGGTRGWYGSLAGRYVDILDVLSADTFAERLRRNPPLDKRNHKVEPISPFEHDLLSQIAGRESISSYRILNPSLMYRELLEAMRTESLDRMLGITIHVPITQENWTVVSEPPAFNLPEEYVTVRFQYNRYCEDEARVRPFFREAIRNLCSQANVVVLDTGGLLGDGRDFDELDGASVLRISPLLSARNSLEVQTAVIAGARAFYGSYSGLGLLAASCGTTSVCYYDKLFRKYEFQMAARVFSERRFGAFVPLSLNEIHKLELLFRPRNNQADAQGASAAVLHG